MIATRHSTVLEVRIRNWLAVFFKYGLFYRLLKGCHIEHVWQLWPIKIDFDCPNAEIGPKMANGQLLFLAL